MCALYSYCAPRISPNQVDAVGCKVSGPIVRMGIDSTVFLCACAPIEREERLRLRVRERDRKEEREREREREREEGGGRDREKERRREGRREKTPQEDVPSFRAKLLFHFFSRVIIPLSRQSCESAPICTGAYMHAQR